MIKEGAAVRRVSNHWARVSGEQELIIELVMKNSFSISKCPPAILLLHAPCEIGLRPR